MPRSSSAASKTVGRTTLEGANTLSKTVKDTGLRQEAAPYHLGTVIFPIDFVDPRWDDGQNRSINKSHQQRLRKLFEKNLDRTNPAHWLRLTCHKDDVESMKAHIHNQIARETQNTTAEPWPNYMDWGHVVQRPAVLLAGHHRVRALQKLLEGQEEEELRGAGERWWICDLYDQAALPPELRIRLRANREDVLLPDSHGQVWNELVTLAQQMPQLFEGKAKDVEQHLSHHLGLTESNKVPVSRLGTLWRNDQWRPVVTELCRFPFGQNLFNISSFAWFSSCRLDDLWFFPFRLAIRVVRVVRDQCQIDLTSHEWAKLVELCPTNPVGASSLSAAFYPSDVKQQKNKADGGGRPRRKGFLARLNNEQYGHVYAVLSGISELQFPDVETWLKMTKDEGKLISVVMTHIGQWLHEQPYAVRDRSSSNKPNLRADFIPALKERHGTRAEEVSITLQRDIAMLVRTRASDLTNSTVKHWVDEYLHGHPNTYCDRFQHEAWLQILNTVYEAGPHFIGTAMRRYNDEPPPQPKQSDLSKLPMVVSRALSVLPELTQHFGLGKSDVLEDLVHRLEPVVRQWVRDHFTEGDGKVSEAQAAPTDLTAAIPSDQHEGNGTSMQQQPVPSPRDDHSPQAFLVPPDDPFPCSSFPEVCTSSQVSPPASSSPGFEDVPLRATMHRVTTHLNHQIRPGQARRVQQSSSATSVGQQPVFSSGVTGVEQKDPPETSGKSRSQQSGLFRSSVHPRTILQDSAHGKPSPSTALLPAKRKASSLSSGNRAWRSSPGIARRS